MVKDFMINNEIGEKKAKGQVYNFIIKQVPGIKRKNLCKQTQKALRIYNLFEKIRIDKIQFIKTYSADIISRFTNLQIQAIIDHFAKKPDIEFVDNQNNSLGEDNNDDRNEDAKSLPNTSKISIFDNSLDSNSESFNNENPYDFDDNYDNKNDFSDNEGKDEYKFDTNMPFSDDDNNENNNNDEYCSFLMKKMMQVITMI
ncbi:hypothetical protein C2G38_2175800 [Gigaspora rosea]|uniref:Uncharacterized protein n=1 Tax=Gigaspora rosea TaxID=44941 RepID=A0A397VIR5_9GLOM|nr:hypothetical protein C2G38_2175800 [Gigaspora rosea]